MWFNWHSSLVEMIDPGKFGVIVARNAGMNADVFADEPEALAWLVGQRRG